MGGGEQAPRLCNYTCTIIVALPPSTLVRLVAFECKYGLRSNLRAPNLNVNSLFKHASSHPSHGVFILFHCLKLVVNQSPQPYFLFTLKWPQGYEIASETIFVPIPCITEARQQSFTCINIKFFAICTVQH